MSLGGIDGGSTITALLGPTNTGKTHRAVERMLEHRSGMIGLPLRLLAREIYERITTDLGESKVALVTGEEKRIPKRPAYWVCTVEAMPVDRAVDFLAVDEVQLASHPERGHVFTDRILHARGVRETWLLGADTMRPMLGTLAPTATVVGHPRLSTLSAAGRTTIATLPPRSAVIAFSMPRVYEIAERIRKAKGGAAVVLGALSPRARNAQVAMYQAGEVSTMVATDAIGMGLNLDIDHVAFADLRKFDGRQARPLESDEIAQIAGRAGRYTRAGTFGTLAPLPEMSEPLRRAVEEHRFSPIRQVVWRNSDLEFETVDALTASLRAAAPFGRLVRVEHADDFSALSELSRRPEVRERAEGRDRVALLWEVCQIPDYRKLWLDDHARIVKDIFLQLTSPAARLSDGWMEKEIQGLGGDEGDIDELLRRIAFVRTWSYVAHRDDWLADGERWRVVTRELEDKLSDALHARLVARFVDRVRTIAVGPPAPVPASPKGRRSPARREPNVRAAVSSPFEQLRHMSVALAVATPAVRHDAWIDALVEAPHDALVVDVTGRVWWEDRAVARITGGADLLRPEVKLTLPGDLGAGARARIARRLAAWLKDWLAECVAPLRDEGAADLSAPARGLVYQLEQRLGTVAVESARDQVQSLDRRDHRLLDALGVRVGSCLVYVPKLLKPPAVARRVTICSVFASSPRGDREASAKGKNGAVRWPDGGAVSVPRHPALEEDLYVAMGYPVFGRRAIRADIAERLHAQVRAMPARPEGEAASQDLSALATVMGCPIADVPGVVAAMTSGSSLA